MMRGLVGPLEFKKPERAFFRYSAEEKLDDRIESTSEINLAILLIAVASSFYGFAAKIPSSLFARTRIIRRVFVKRHIKLIACVLRELTIVVIMDVHRIIAAAELLFFKNTICIASRWWFLSTIRRLLSLSIAELWIVFFRFDFDYRSLPAKR